MRKYKHNPYFLAATIFIVTLITLAFSAEWMARVLNLSKTRTSYLDKNNTIRADYFTSETIGRKRKPNLNLNGTRGTHFTTNSSGFRDVEWKNVDDGKTKIAFLGDSVTEGFGISGEDRFTQNLGGNFQTFNFGVADTSTIDQLVFLKEDVLPFKPNLIFLQFGFNDLERNKKLSANVSVPAPPPPPSKLKSFLAQNSAFYLFLAERFQFLGLRIGFLKSSPILKSIELANDEDWQPTFNKLDELVGVCQSHSIPLIVSYFPLEVEVLVHEKEKAHLIEGRLTAYAKRKNLKYFSVIDLLRENSHSHLYLDDVHLSEKGNQLIAKALTDYLISSKDALP